MKTSIFLVALVFPFSAAIAGVNLDTIVGQYTLMQGQQEAIGCESKLVFQRGNDPHTLTQYLENTRGFKATYQMQNINLGPKVLTGTEPGTIFGTFKSISSTTFNSKKNMLTYEQRNLNSRLGINTSDRLYVVTYQINGNALKVTHFSRDGQETLAATASCLYTKD